MVWKSIPWYGGYYEASDVGVIRSKDRVILKPHSQSGRLCEYKYKGRILSQWDTRHGHKNVRIGVNGEKYSVQVGRLVLLAFIGEPPKGYECCHNNGKAGDNRLINLRWDSHYENNQDRKRHGTYPTGSRHPMSKFEPSFILGVATGEINKDEAIARGMSHTHYYRIKGAGIERAKSYK